MHLGHLRRPHRSDLLLGTVHQADRLAHELVQVRRRLSLLMIPLNLPTRSLIDPPVEGRRASNGLTRTVDLDFAVAPTGSYVAWGSTGSGREVSSLMLLAGVLLGLMGVILERRMQPSLFLRSYRVSSLWPMSALMPEDFLLVCTPLR